MSLRKKILSGFAMLAAILLGAGAWSVHELVSIGASSGDALDEDHEVLAAVRTMNEGLERVDGGTLLLLQGKWEEGRRAVAAGDSLFERGFRMARTRKSIEENAAYLETIGEQYDRYRAMWERPIVGTAREGDLAWYARDLHGAFLDVRSSLNDLLASNGEIMYRAAVDLRSRSRRSIMPWIIALASSIVFVLLFNFFVNFYVVSPLLRIRDGVYRFIERRVPFDIDVETGDEISELAEAIGRLCLEVQPQEAAE